MFARKHKHTVIATATARTLDDAVALAVLRSERAKRAAATRRANALAKAQERAGEVQA